MQIGIGLPNTAANPRAETVLGFARAADQGGLHALWTIDRMVFPLLDALTTLAVAAGATKNVKLGTAILVEPTHDPVLVAAQVATMDVLSEGRVILGLGVGSRQEDYAVTGRDFHTRGRRLEADVATMRRIWAGESLVEGFGPTGPRPVQPSIPVVFGGSSDRAMQRAARIGDGYVSVPRGQARHAEMFEKFRRLWREAGREGSPTLYAQGYVCVADTPEAGRARIAEYQAHYYGTRPRASGGASNELEYDLVGPPEVIAEALVGYQRLGADAIILLPAVADVEQAEAIAGPVQAAFQKTIGA
jgi:alkanesulfonate monooxygenase SsuD/methylene tetrahydromethanopterin reductase-like flavin-dependent oxidoreductase (luciferase family)